MSASRLVDNPDITQFEGYFRNSGEPIRTHSPVDLRKDSHRHMRLGEEEEL
jgi:hypothetical protein